MLFADYSFIDPLESPRRIAPPFYRPAASTLGPRPGFTFGSSSRDQSRRLFVGVGLTQTGAMSPGPNQNICYGFRAPSSKFGTGTRAQTARLYAGHGMTRPEDNAYGPGPAAYSIPSGFRSAPSSPRSPRSAPLSPRRPTAPKYRAPPGFSFGTSSRDQCRRMFTGHGHTQPDDQGSPGPAVYNTGRGFDNAPSLVFGSASRESVRKVFAGQGLTRATDTNDSPGPAAYPTPVKPSMPVRRLSER